MSRTPSSIGKEKASSEFVGNENEIEIKDIRALSDKPSGFGDHLIVSDTILMTNKQQKRRMEAGFELSLTTTLLGSKERWCKGMRRTIWKMRGSGKIRKMGAVVP